MDGSADARIRATAAEIAVHGRADVCVGRVWIVGQQARRLHLLPGLTVATLGHLMRNPSRLDR